MTNEQHRLLVVQAALAQTTATKGWQYVKEIADNVVKSAIQESLDEEDAAKGESKRLKASALQKGFAQLFQVIEATESFGTDEEPDWFTQLNEFQETEVQ